MTTTTPELRSTLARTLHEAERTRTEVPPLTATHADLTLDDAYLIQEELVRISGGQTVGLKAALTSRAKQQAMNVSQPGFGVLLDWMQVDDVLDTSGLIHPRVEPEVALFFEDFFLTRRLTASCVARQVKGFAAAFEVIDSRYQKFKFTASDVYADNCSSARYAIAPTFLRAAPEDLVHAGVVVEKNGEVVQTGTPAAVLGHPYASAAFILNLAFERRVALPSRFVLLTGGITEAVPVAPGDHMRASFGGGFGELSLRVV